MTTLFDTDEPEAAAAPAPAEPAPHEELVRALVALKIEERRIRKWSRQHALNVYALVDRYAVSAKSAALLSPARAEAVLGRCRLTKFQDTEHGTAAAQRVEEEERAKAQERAASPRDRLVAAKSLEEALAAPDAEAVLLALQFAMWPLTHVELRDAAGLVIQQLRIDPATGARIEEPAEVRR